jgi:hypothetical protein
MKVKLAIAAALFCGASTAANAAQPAPGLNLGGLITPAFKLVDTTLPTILNPVLEPVLSQTGPAAGNFVASLHTLWPVLTPVFVTVDSVAGVVTLPQVNLPGLPN